ncbi:hypothetical protein AB0G32_03740 [Streptomyces sp. NPDC023723]|uniref:hypothetical protein n=1 Tax=Streptomyces sp. NPDC023723 TaxID=3154323 RepID=UPI0033C5B5B2
MRSDIVVASISALSAVVVAVVALRGTPRRERPHEPVITFGALCGLVSGAAASAVGHCEADLRTLLEGGRLDRPAGRIYAGFQDRRREADARADETIRDYVLWQPAPRAFADELYGLCQALDNVVVPAGVGRLAGLGDWLARLAESRRRLDEQFDNCLDGHLSEISLNARGAERRRIWRAARERYDSAFSSGNVPLVGPVPPPPAEPPDPEPDPGAARTAPEPACGGCVWRCPHAPAGWCAAAGVPEQRSAAPAAEPVVRALPPGSQV